MASELRYTIPIEPVTKKNSQRILTNHKTGRNFIAPSENYARYAEDAPWYLKPVPKRPIDIPVEVVCSFYMATERSVDLTNLQESIDDILVRCGILKDDNYKILASHDGSRVYVDPEHPRTEIIIRAVKK